MTSANSKLGTFYLVRTFEGDVVEHIPITKEQFVLQAKGLIASKANKWRIDHFVVNQLESCQASYDQYRNDYTIDCSVLDQLWRLRFSEFPLASKITPEDLKGWSAKPYMPSDRQWEILKRYGVERVDEPFYGDNAWNLLKDISDPNWINSYRGKGE